MRGEGWLRRMLDREELGEVPLPGVALVELAGDRRVLIEHHCGVTEYTLEQIRVRVSFGSLMICGDQLLLNRMNQGQLVITGRIDEIRICRR